MAQTAQQPQKILYPKQSAGRILATLIQGEWKTAALMQDKAQQPQTRAYARLVAAEESHAWKRLQSAADGADLREVPELKQEWQIFRSILRNQSGATADRDYLRGEIEVETLVAAALPSLASFHPRLAGAISGLLAGERRHVVWVRRAQASFAGALALGAMSEGSIWSHSLELPGLQYVFPAQLRKPPRSGTANTSATETARLRRSQR